MRFILPVVMAAAACVPCGCGPADGNSSEPRQAPGSHAAASAAEMISQTGVIAMVRSSPAGDGPGTTSDWVDRQLKQLPGEIMFPSWVAERRGASKFEVQFKYTLIDKSNRIVKRGYAWTVDAPLNLVGPPREIAPEFAPSSDHADHSAKEQRRVTEEQSSLE